MENNDNLILQELRKITETLQEHGQEFKKITETLQEHGQELKKHTEQFKTINKRLETMDKRLENIENIVNKGVYVDIVRLEKRIEALEQKQAI
jgi:predicted  nucleic acid-binding Zn-ribbon protein